MPTPQEILTKSRIGILPVSNIGAISEFKRTAEDTKSAKKEKTQKKTESIHIS